MKDKLLERFLRYVKIDTQSDDNSTTFPSTDKQFNLAKLLVEELKELGISDANVDENCYVTGTLKSNSPENSAVVGFLAHMDTATNLPGDGVNPQIIKNYDGSDITLPKGNNIQILLSENPYLKTCVGDTIITTDGTTLLGADDKAGIAIIMTAIDYLINNPSIKHGDVKIGFTPDEEIGQGTKYFDIEKFGADFAVTVDGHMPGEINRETFSADMATVTINGKDIHPGQAKDVMVNSLRVASHIIASLPCEFAPETTDNHEPFIHPLDISGDITKAEFNLILRAFTNKELEALFATLNNSISETQVKFPNAKIETKLVHQYKNMYDYIKDKPKYLDAIWQSAKDSGIEPHWAPIRGGTDGSRLSEKGLPTPNIFAGYANCHSTTEYASLNSMMVSVNTLINLAKNTLKISK